MEGDTSIDVVAADGVEFDNFNTDNNLAILESVEYTTPHSFSVELQSPLPPLVGASPRV